MLKFKSILLILFSAFLIIAIYSRHDSLIEQNYFEECKHLFQNNQATDQFVKLLGLTGIRVKNDKLKADSNWPEARMWLPSRDLKEITDAIQGKTDSSISWKIATGKERWENEGLSYIKFSLEQGKLLINLILKDLKIGETVKPKQKEYKGILFLGTSLEGVRNRLGFLNKCIKENSLKFEKVWLLTGYRPLDEAIGETNESLLDPKGLIALRPDWKQPAGDLPNDEGAMIEWVFNQSRSDLIKKDQIVMVYAPKEEGGRRATTKTTLIEFLNHKPEDGLYLAVSDQPYSLYQYLVLKHNLNEQNREGIQIEIIGAMREGFYGADFSNQEKLNKYIAVLLDNISKICYELTAIQELKAKKS